MPASRTRSALRYLAELPRSLRLVLIGVTLLHGIGLWWGMPASDAWDNDGVAPRDVLPGVVATYSPGDYFTYPPLHLLLLTVLTLPFTLLALVHAGTTAVPVVIRTIIEPPYMTAITMIARVVTLSMSVGVVLFIALTAREIAGAKGQSERANRTAAFAGLFASLNWAFDYYSHTTNLDVPYLFWATLALLRLVQAVARSEPKRLRGFAVYAACAIATKDQAYAMFALGAPAAILVWAAVDRPRFRPIAREALLALAIAAVTVLVIDGAPFNPSGFRARVRFLTGPASKDFEILARTTEGRVVAFVDSFLYFRRHYPPAVGVFPVLGLGVTLARARKDGRLALAAALVPLFVALSFALAFNVTALRTEERFTLPQMMVVALYAGAGLDALWNAATGALRIAARAVVVAGLGWAALECIRVDATFLAEPRYDAEAFLARTMEPADTVETYGINVALLRFPRDRHAVRVGPGDPKKRSPIPGLDEVQAPYSAVEERKPRFVVVNDCWAWRYLLHFEEPPALAGYVFPAVQKSEGADQDATTYFRALFAGELSYRLAETFEIRAFPRAYIHASLGCPIYVFERRR